MKKRNCIYCNEYTLISINKEIDENGNSYITAFFCTSCGEVFSFCRNKNCSNYLKEMKLKNWLKLLSRNDIFYFDHDFPKNNINKKYVGTYYKNLKSYHIDTATIFLWKCEHCLDDSYVYCM